MDRYIVCLINGNRREAKRAIDADSHKAAYEKFLEIELEESNKVLSFPILTLQSKSKTEKIWVEHQIDIKAAEKEELIEIINHLSKSVDNKDNYIELTFNIICFSENKLKCMLAKDLVDWSEEERKFYLIFNNYPGRKDYLKELAEKKNGDPNEIMIKNSEIMIKKMDATLQLLVNIADTQSANNKKLGKMADGAKMSSILSAIALQHEMSED